MAVLGAPMSLPSREIDPNLLTKSQVLPWLSSRFNVATSRTFWIFIAIAMLIALLFHNQSYPNTLYTVAGMLIIVALATLKMFLRSNVPLTLLLLVFFANYALTSLWLGVAVGLNPFLNGAIDYLMILLPPALLLLMERIVARLPSSTLHKDSKNALVAWLGLRRATTLVMLTAASGAAFVFVNVVNQQVMGRIVEPEVSRMLRVIHHLPIKKDAVIQFSYKGRVHKDPDTGKMTNVHTDEVDYDGWHDRIGAAIGGAAYLKGAKALVPRLMVFLFGVGAYAAVVAYLFALSRSWPAERRTRFLAVSIPVAVAVEIVWTLGVGVLIDSLAVTGFALIAGFVLLFVCLHAMGLDRQSGYGDTARGLGASFALPNPAQLSAQPPAP
jgi:hypothetical protein